MLIDLLTVGRQKEQAQFLFNCFQKRWDFQRTLKHLFERLIAHVIEGGKFDWRENTLVLSLLDHSAVKIGVNNLGVRS